MKTNFPIITFLQRSWMLTVFMVLSNFAVLSNHEFFKIWTRDNDGNVVYVGQTLFQILGAVLYIPAMASVVVWVALLFRHLYFRESIDKDINDGTYLLDWRAVTPTTRIWVTNFVLIGMIIALCILCSTLAKG